MDLRVIQDDPGLRHVMLSGRLDAAAAQDFEPIFRAHVLDCAKPVLVDLAELTFLASMGMRMLLTAAQELNRKGGRLVLCGVQPLAERALRAAGFDLVMAVVRDKAEALELLKRR